MAVRANLTGRMGRWSAQHPWKAIGVWLLFIAVVAVGGGAAGTVKLTDAARGSGDSAKAQRVVDEHFTSRASEQVLVHSPAAPAADPRFRAAVADTVARLQATNLTEHLQSPLEADHANQVSRDGHSALIQFDITGPSATASDRVGPLLAAVEAAGRAHPGFTISEAGDASISKALNDSIGKDFKKAEQLSLPITLIVLLVAFGALVAALVPVALALTAIVGAGGLLAFTSHLSGVDSSSSSVMLLIGLAVGVDYSLFYIKREREERAAGRSKDAALAAAAATSGRSVLISGVTVMIAMAGMFLTGSKIFIGMAEATMLVVATAMVGSLTALPALLALLGDRINAGRLPFLGRGGHGRAPRRRFWTAVLKPVLRRPAIATALSAAVLLALAAPVVKMHTAQPGSSDVPHTSAAMRALDAIQAAFPGGGAPAVVMVTTPDAQGPATQRAIAELRRVAVAKGVLNEPFSARPSSDNKAVMIVAALPGTGEDARSATAVQRLRSEVIPATLGTAGGVTAYVTGMTAGTEDFNALMRHRAPLVFGFVLLLAFLLMLASFRSVVIAAKAIVLNLLSVGAAYGVLVAVFQWGWGESLLHFKSTHSITSWLPLFLFVILFGLSMDYHVFIISRIRELHDQGVDTRTAVRSGITSTAGVVTAAAVVMVFVFATFATLGQVSMKQLGVGLAVAVLLDATVVRGVLLPASMTLLGRANWYLPSWLGWLPQISHGTEPDLTTAQAPQATPTLHRELVGSGR
jgi:putative drug exporter of the RND superfamily